jgi:hypothetical protein
LALKSTILATINVAGPPVLVSRVQLMELAAALWQLLKRVIPLAAATTVAGGQFGI